MYNVKPFSKKRLVFSVLLNVTLLLVALLVFVPFFEEIDDTHIAMIAEGAYGTRDWHLIYPNFILGKIYVFLYSLIPFLRWHTIIQYVMIFMAYVMSTYAVSKHKYGYLLALTTSISTFYEMYVSLQYTKTAAFMTVAGLILIYEFVRNEKAKALDASTVNKEDLKIYGCENRFYIGFAVLFMIYGALLRPEAFLIACIPMFFVGCVELVRTKMILKYVFLLFPIFLSILVCIFLNDAEYKKDQNWSDFMRYNKARMQLTDYRYDILHYPTNEKRLKELNVSENDAWLIVTYQFGDDEVFSTDRMENIRASFDSRPFGIQVFKNLWESIGNEILRKNVILPILLCFIILLIATIISERSRSDSKAIKEAFMKFFAMIGIGFFSGAALVYFQYSGRWSHRLVAALVIPVIYAIAYLLDSPLLKEEDRDIVFGGNISEKSSLILALALIIALVANVFACINNRNECVSSLEMINDKILLMETFEENPDTLFVFDTFTLQNSFKYDLFLPVKEGAMKNTVSCGSWFLNSPITKKSCELFGYTNPYQALRDTNGPAVLLDTYFSSEKAEFLTEHYNKLYNAVEIGSIGNIAEYVMEITE